MTKTGTFDTFSGTNGTSYALAGTVGLVCRSAKEVNVMIDPMTASSDRMRTTDRWGYTGDLVDDPVPMIEESGGVGRWLLWVAVAVIAVIVAIALFGGVM
jgi:hypothetical protein